MTIDDDLMAQLREAAHRRGLSMRKLIDQALRAGLRSLTGRKPGSRSCPAFAMGRPVLDLDRALALASSLEDEEIVRKLELRK